MPVLTSTDHDEFVPLLDRLIAADPVRGTLLGSIRLALTGSAWAAWATGADGAPTGEITIRSSAEWPVLLSGPWHGSPAVPALVAELVRLDDLAGVSGTPEVVGPIVEALDRPAADDVAQRLYRCDELVEPEVEGTWLIAGDAHRQLVRDWWAAFAREAHGIIKPTDAMADTTLDARQALLWVDPDGTPVSLAARRPVALGSARVGPVYTPPALRGHGYASGVTAAATRSILDEHAVPVLFTDLANPTSNSIYRALGYRAVEDRRVVVFEQ